MVPAWGMPAYRIICDPPAAHFDAALKLLAAEPQRYPGYPGYMGSVIFRILQNHVPRGDVHVRACIIIIRQTVY